MSRSDMRQAVQKCVAAGLVYDDKHKHPRIIQPSTGRFVTISRTPSCPHAPKNFLADVRRYLGVDVHL
jgi:hypothetical protein